jgi:membrane protein implicated in regulation of membrane protease activity
VGDQDADADADTDLDADADADTDLDADADADATHSPAPGALSALGIGRVPLMLVMMSYLGGFGAAGLLANSLLSLGGGYPSWGLFVALVAAAIVAVPLTGALSRLFGRITPRSSTAITHEQLVGRVGTVSSPTVSESYGRVAVRDPHGSIHTVYAVIEQGPPLTERAEVALIRYDAGQRRFVVRSLDTPRR